MIQILKDMGITEYEPRVINQMLEFTYSKLFLFQSQWEQCSDIPTEYFWHFRTKKDYSELRIMQELFWTTQLLFVSTGYVTTIIEDAKTYASHANKSNVDADDIRLAIQCRMDQSFTSPPPRDVSLHRWAGVTFASWFVRQGFRMSVRKMETADSILIIKTVTLQEPADCSDRADLIAASPSLCFQFLLEVARQKNQTPLPLIKPYTGPRLPPDRYCLTAPNYRLKSIQKKVRHNLSWSSSAFTLSLFVVTNSLFSRCRRLPTGYRCLASVSAPSPAGRPRPRSVSFSFIIMWFINPSIKVRFWMLKA